MSAIDEFRAALQRAGIDYAGDIIGDGIRHRIPIDSRDHRKSASYILHCDERPAGMIWNFRQSEDGIPWKLPTDAKPLTEAERRALKERSDTKRRELERKTAKDQADAAKRARRIWGAAEPCFGHPYLNRKQVVSYGLRSDVYYRYVDGRTVPIPGALYVPMYAGPRNLVSLQAIFPSADNPLGRDRDFLPGGRKDGCYFRIGKPDGIVAVCEGYATGASVHQATGWCVMVAMTAGNLVAVASLVRAALPAVRIIVAADNDQWTTLADGTPFNPGVVRASEAAETVRGIYVTPIFGSLDDKPTDWNDLHCREGLDRVVGQLMAVHDLL